MNVLQILYSGLGGHGSVAFALAAAASAAGDRGWRTGMVFLGIEPLLPEYEALCAQRTIPRHYIRATAGKPWRSWTGLFAALKAAAPDAIVLHSVKAILPCWLYARGRGLPVVAVEHQTNSLKTRSEWVASALLMLLADTVVVLTPDYRDALKRGLGPFWREDKVALIPNGIDIEAFAPGARRPLDGRPCVVGMAARFSAGKRQDRLVEAAARLRDADGADHWRLTLAGDGETRPELAARAAAAGLDGIVDFPGYLGDAPLKAWFETLDIYVHASDGETLSTSLLQAMAKGLPIVGSDVAGISDLLARAGGCGLLAADQSPEAFAAALRTLRQDPDLAQRLAAAGRRLAEDEFSQGAMFAAYRKVLERACPRSFT